MSIYRVFGKNLNSVLRIESAYCKPSPTGLKKTKKTKKTKKKKKKKEMMIMIIIDDDDDVYFTTILRVTSWCSG